MKPSDDTKFHKGTKKKQKIIDDTFTVIENDIEKVQKSPTMYISYREEKGVQHLAQEMLNNMFDEHRNPRSISDGEMFVFYDYETEMIYFKDHGRGINFDDLESACTILQAGTKMDREFGGASGGEHGVGLTATNALSEQFEITSIRGGKSKFIKFINGEKVDEKIIPVDPDKHGLMVAFKPSKAFLGMNAILPLDEFSEWIHRTSYTLEPEIKITLRAENVPGYEDENGNALFERTYQNSNGLGIFIPEIIGDTIGYILDFPIVLKNKITLVEDNIPERVIDENGRTIINMISKERFIEVEFAFNYSPQLTTPKAYGFTNMIEQPDGGVHINSLQTVLSEYLSESAIATLHKKESLKILPDDALSGLALVVNLNTTMTTGFESQTKHKLGNRKFIQPLKRLYKEAITNYFDTAEGKKMLIKLIDFVKFNAKLRTDTSKKRNQVKTSMPTLMGSKLIKDYTAANLINTPKDQLPIKLELYIGEGDSVGGQLRIARWNPDYQGILCTTGKPKNCYKLKQQGIEVLPKGVFFTTLFDDILGCGYGNHFNIDNLIYDKIIFAYDADVDGEHIGGLTISSIWAYAPELILQGHCYRSITPLYKIAKSQADANRQDRETTNINPADYVYFKSDIFKSFEQVTSKHVRLKFNKDDNYISCDNMRRFLATNRDYYEVLDRMSEILIVNKDVIEYIATHPDYETSISELDRELTYNKVGNTIYGCYQGEFLSIMIDKKFNQSIEYLRKAINNGNDGIYQYHLYERKGEKGEFNYGAIRFAITKVA